MSKDLMSNPYGRFYYLSLYLSELGHQIQLILVSYKNDENEVVEHDNLRIRSVSLLPNPLRSISIIYQIIKEADPQWIIGFSDTYYGILAEIFSRFLNKKCLIDAYDNFEAYIPWLKPLHWLWRGSLNRADRVTCAGPALEKLFRNYRHTGAIKILPMTVDPAGFAPMPREQCRKRLNLPNDKILIGYHGAISYTRDISVLFDAVEQLQRENPRILLVLSGKLASNIKVPETAMNLGYLPDSHIPSFVNSMDLLAVTNRDSKFGQYSHPIKIYEAMACHIPVVATQTRATEWILRDHPNLLVKPGNTDAFVKALNKNLYLDRVQYANLQDWRELASQLDDLLQV